MLGGSFLVDLLPKRLGVFNRGGRLPVAPTEEPVAMVIFCYEYSLKVAVANCLVLILFHVFLIVLKHFPKIFILLSSFSD